MKNGFLLCYLQIVHHYIWAQSLSVKLTTGGHLFKLVMQLRQTRYSSENKVLLCFQVELNMIVLTIFFQFGRKIKSIALSVLTHNIILVFIEIKRNMIVATVFLLIKNPTVLQLVHNQIEHCHCDHIPLNLHEN